MINAFIPYIVKFRIWVQLNALSSVKDADAQKMKNTCMFIKRNYYPAWHCLLDQVTWLVSFMTIYHNDPYCSYGEVLCLALGFCA